VSRAAADMASDPGGGGPLSSVGTPVPEGDTTPEGGTAAPAGLPAGLETAVRDLWARREGLASGDPEATEVIRVALGALERGELRVAEVVDGGTVVVREWARWAILLAFRVFGLEESAAGPFTYFDRLALKRGWPAAGVRAVPGAIVRVGAYIGPGAVLMPSFVNVGAYVGAETLVDTWATVGSCAQVGARVHLSGGVGLGGVLEPPNARPVVVEDDALIGSRAVVTDGARVGQGAVVGAGVVLNPSIPVVDAATGEELGRGEVPPWSVAVAGTRWRHFPGGDFGLPCVLVIRRLTPGERHTKAGLEAILREHGVAT